MNRNSTILKIAAIASSITLAAGFIGYRAGAFDWVFGSSKQPDVMSSSKVMVISGPNGTESGEITTTVPMMMSGSKSLAPLVPSQPSSTPTESGKTP